MTQKYNYELQKGSKHIICPNCRKKTFKPYVEAGTNNIVDAVRELTTVLTFSILNQTESILTG